jgi:hypothetical protein
MSETAELAQLERQRDTLRAEARKLWARATGIDAEITARREGLRPTEPLVTLSLADAVEQMLRDAGRTMAPSEIVAALAEAGRQDNRASLGGTLQYLQSQGRVTRLGRGKWQATA